MTLDVDGTKIDYAFNFTVTSQIVTVNVGENDRRQMAYCYASLSAATYREGEITLDGKKYRVVLVDYNSNGRFDDKMVVDENLSRATGQVYPRQGDMIYVAGEKSQDATPAMMAASRFQHYVGRLIGLDDKYYDLTITPAGDRLTLEPSSVPTGLVTNPNAGYTAEVYGDLGFLKISGDDSGKAVPARGRVAVVAVHDRSHRQRGGETEGREAEGRGLFAARFADPHVGRRCVDGVRASLFPGLGAGRRRLSGREGSQGRND